jgi:hypothetical protein
MFCDRSSVVICVGAGTDDMAVPMFTPMYAPARNDNNKKQRNQSVRNLSFS